MALLKDGILVVIITTLLTSASGDPIISVDANPSQYGTPETLKCIDPSNPSGNGYIWRKDGAVIFSNTGEENTIGKYSASNDGTTLKLVIKDIVVSDEGKYTCNTNFADSNTLDLEVESRGTVTAKLTSSILEVTFLQIYPNASSAIINCDKIYDLGSFENSVSDGDRLTVTWKFTKISSIVLNSCLVTLTLRTTFNATFSACITASPSVVPKAINITQNSGTGTILLQATTDCASPVSEVSIEWYYLMEPTDTPRLFVTNGFSPVTTIDSSTCTSIYCPSEVGVYKVFSFVTFVEKESGISVYLMAKMEHLRGSSVVAITTRKYILFEGREGYTDKPIAQSTLTLSQSDGDTVTLSCSLLGSFTFPEWRGPPSLTLYTYRGDTSRSINPVAPAASRLQYASNNRDLILSSVATSDTGEYKCTSTGLGDHTITLTFTKEIAPTVKTETNVPGSNTVIIVSSVVGGLFIVGMVIMVLHRRKRDIRQHNMPEIVYASKG